MARYRLRFLLQEIDLPPGDTLIGRSPECRVSIEDPLVSRQHARVRLLPDGTALFDDLGSRNGSRVNGVLVREPLQLKDGDRLRIGTQELVFCKVATIPHTAGKQTGFLRHCASCNLPYPEEMVACPNCGSTERAADADPQQQSEGQSWTLQLLVEVLDKALALGRQEDAERIMQKVVAAVDERAAGSGAFDPKQIHALGESVLRLAELQASTRWARWVLETYGVTRIVPPPGLADRIARLPRPEQLELLRPIEDVVARMYARGGTMTQDELEGVRKLELLHARLRVPD